MFCFLTIPQLIRPALLLGLNNLRVLSATINLFVLVFVQQNTFLFLRPGHADNGLAINICFLLKVLFLQQFNISNPRSKITYDITKPKS